jgi:plasmid stability protein
MASITIKNIPDPLLARLRALAEDDDRSLNKEMIHLLEEAVQRRQMAETEDSLGELALRQGAAWRALRGRWESEDDGRALMNARTPGREIDL